MTSPTFTLMQEYDAAAGFRIYHFDLYRLKAAGELVEIGFDEALGSGLTLIEWPQLASEYLPAGALTIRIEYGGDEKKRRITLTGADNVWQDRLKAVIQ